MCNRQAFHAHWGSHPKHWHRSKWANKFQQHSWNYPPVNVEELDDHYEISVFAPGYDKTNFQLQIRDDLLTIQAVLPKPDSFGQEQWQRREFTPKTFKRQFSLNEKIDKDSIKAKYEGGVLVITCQKLPGHESVSQDIIVD